MDSSMERAEGKVLVEGNRLTYNRAIVMPILTDQTLEFISHSAEQTRRLGVRLGELLQPTDLICLSGDLGSGKTTLVQGIARGWGALDEATSPTFVIINQYRRADSARMYHLDAFRLSGSAEAEAMGIYELLDSDGPLVIEWPERIPGILPEERWWVQMQWVDESRRRLRIDAAGSRYIRLLRDFQKSAFGG